MRVLGRDINRLSFLEMLELRRHMGVAFQSGALFSSLSVVENIKLPLREHTDLDETISRSRDATTICTDGGAALAGCGRGFESWYLISPSTAATTNAKKSEPYHSLVHNNARFRLPLPQPPPKVAARPAAASMGSPVRGASRRVTPRWPQGVRQWGR